MRVAAGGKLPPGNNLQLLLGAADVCAAARLHILEQGLHVLAEIQYVVMGQQRRPTAHRAVAIDDFPVLDDARRLDGVPERETQATQIVGRGHAALDETVPCRFDEFGRQAADEKRCNRLRPRLAEEVLLVVKSVPTIAPEC